MTSRTTLNDSDPYPNYSYSSVECSPFADPFHIDKTLDTATTKTHEQMLAFQKDTTFDEHSYVSLNVNCEFI